MADIGTPVPPAGPVFASVRERLAGATLRTRLNGLFVVGSVLLVVVVVASAISFERLLHARHTVLQQVDPANIAADQLFVAYLNEETGVRGYVLSGKTIFLQPYLTGVADESAAVRKLGRLLASKTELLKLATDAEQQAAKWQQSYARPAITSVSTNETAYGSQAALLKSKSLFDGVRSRFARLDARLATERVKASSQLRSATTFLIWVLFLTLAFLITTAVIANRALRTWVTQPLRAIGSESRSVAAGNLDVTITPIGPSDFRQLARDVEAMRNRIALEFENAESARAELAERNVDLSRSNVELEQFAYVASHDLQEPLRKIASFTQLLQQRYQGQLDERADQYIEFAVDGAKRMQVLINDLLAFSRVGRTTERLVEIELAVTVRAGMANLRSAIEESGAEIELGVLPTVVGDPGLFGALWQNLIGNAIKFRSEATPLVKIEAEQTSEDEWTISVADNGIGVEPRFADKIFVIFQRLHSRDAYEGTGIGLALCKKIVEFHGGRIWLDPAHQPGTRIFFTVPGSGPSGG